TTKTMDQKGMVLTPVLLAGAIAFLLASGLSVLVGYHARIGALLLAVFLALAAYFFHDFWNVEGKEQVNQMNHFMKNLGLFGAMVFIRANGPGGWSVDARRGR